MSRTSASPARAARDCRSSLPARIDNSQALCEAPTGNQSPLTCPPPRAPGRPAGRVIACHPEHGWSLLRSGVVVLDDTGALLPDGSAIGSDGIICPPGNGGLTHAGHVRMVASVPPGRARATWLRPSGPAIVSAGSAKQGVDSWPG